MEPAEDVLPDLPVERANAVGESAPAGQAVETAAHAGGESVSTPAGQAQEDNKELASSCNTHPLHLQKKTDTEDHSNWVSRWVDCPACLMPLREGCTNENPEKVLSFFWEVVVQAGMVKKGRLAQLVIRCVCVWVG